MRIEHLFEDENKSVAFSFGRMNPPTIGHGQVFDTLANVNKDYRIFVSPAQTPKKDNPLDFATKVKFIKAMFPNHSSHVSDDPSLNTIMKVAVSLYQQGYKNVTIVAGSDRLESFKKLLDQYNGVESAHGLYNFENIDYVSSGDRDPDADGLEGISASAAREAARQNNLKQFANVTGAGKFADELYKAVRAGLNIKESEMFTDLSVDYKKFIKEDVIAYDPNGYWDVYLWGNWYRGKHFDYGPRKVAVPGTTESEALEWVQNHADDIYEYYYKKKFYNGKRMLPHPVDKNLFLDKTKPIGPSQSYRVPPTESVVEAPIELDPAEPMNPMIYGAGGNPAKLQYRMARAAGQLKDLAARAASASPSEWQMISKHFEELTMNINQIKHGLEELAKQRRKGGIRSRGIDPMIDSIEESIKKIGSKFRLVSKSSGKNLGTYDTRAGAEKRERQVQYFKHKG